jgi:hypothetical protein
MRRTFELTSKTEDDENEDVKAYLAMSSSDDEEESDENETSLKESQSTDNTCEDRDIVHKDDTIHDALEIYKSAIAEVEQKKRAKKNCKKEKFSKLEVEGNMEMTFTSNNIRDGQTALGRDLKQKLEENMAPWEKYLNKKKEKQKKI